MPELDFEDLLMSFFFFDPRIYAAVAEEQKRDPVSFVNGAYYEQKRCLELAIKMQRAFEVIAELHHDDFPEVKELMEFLKQNTPRLEGR